MYILIDNYDSFTFNLYHYLLELGAECEVVRNDAASVETVLAAATSGLILSPGPCTPDDAGICLDLIAAAAGRTPLLGVCLGHQAIGQVFGGSVIRAPQVMHGKTSAIRHDGHALFKGLADPFTAARYHSLIIAEEDFPHAELAITARSDDGLIMGLAHHRHALYGVQFHPESIASEHGHDLLRNFIRLSADPMPGPAKHHDAA